MGDNPYIPSPEQMAAALRKYQADGRDADTLRFLLEGGGGMGEGIVGGGLTAGMEIPVPLMGGMTLSPKVEIGGAYGSVDTPYGKYKVREKAPTDYSIMLHKNFEF